MVIATPLEKVMASAIDVTPFKTILPIQFESIDTFDEEYPIRSIRYLMRRQL